MLMSDNLFLMRNKFLFPNENTPGTSSFGHVSSFIYSLPDNQSQRSVNVLEAFTHES